MRSAFIALVECLPVYVLEVEEEAGDEDGGEPAKLGERGEECQVRAVVTGEAERRRTYGSERPVM